MSLGGDITKGVGEGSDDPERAAPPPFGGAVLLDRDLKILAISPSLCGALELESGDIVGQPWRALGAAWSDQPQLGRLLERAVKGAAAAETDLVVKHDVNGVRRLIARVEPLACAADGDIWVLISVTDAQARVPGDQADDQGRRNDRLLLREVRHRVANSLQIVAGMLLRTAQGGEPDARLHTAYGRVMAVAALERQLSGASQDDVDLQRFLTTLCDAMGTWAIDAPETVSLRCFVDSHVVSAAAATRIGMIVTELVMNALKYAFPAGRGGRVTVAYDVQGPNWRLSVSDSGVGMPVKPQPPGLGTEIVNGLARQLGARVMVTDAVPGSIVTVSFSPPPLRAVPNDVAP